MEMDNQTTEFLNRIKGLLSFSNNKYVIFRKSEFEAEPWKWSLINSMCDLKIACIDWITPVDFDNSLLTTKTPRPNRHSSPEHWERFKEEIEEKQRKISEQNSDISIYFDKDKFLDFYNLQTGNADDEKNYWFDGNSLKLKRADGSIESFKLSGDTYKLLFALVELLKTSNSQKNGYWLQAEIPRETILKKTKEDMRWLKDTVANLKRALKEDYENYIIISSFSRSKGTYTFGLKMPS